MLLRDHPLMTCKGLRSWPPAWLWIYGEENKYPRGEVGTLQEVVLSNINPADRCFLYNDYKGSTYVGCLLIENQTFCAQIVNVLQGHCSCPITDIGSLDVAHTL
jgi:hypothetical protein